ncbi:MAG: hypothetical protein KF850_04720 [Labilithrix sp.]|nr:hypothetical protein [Labilithrix sp.]
MARRRPRGTARTALLSLLLVLAHAASARAAEGDEAATPPRLREPAPDPVAGASPAQSAGAASPRRWAFLSVRQDFAWVDGDRVCSPEVQRAGDFSCFRANGTQYLGTPRPEDAARVSGASIATTRVLATYQHFLGAHWAAAATAGVVLRGGGPRSVGRDAQPFLPFHLEGQVSWWPTGAPARGEGPAAFVLLGGGLAQVDSKLSLTVREDPTAAPPPSQLDNPERQTLDVYKKTGTGFAAVGGGVAAATSRSLIWRFALEATAAFPAFGLGAALEAGVGFDL